MTDQKIQNRELAGYFSYAVGQCLSFGLVGSFILYFYTDILGISPAAAGRDRERFEAMLRGFDRPIWV